MARGLVDGAYFAGCFLGGDVANKARQGEFFWWLNKMIMLPRRPTLKIDGHAFKMII